MKSASLYKRRGYFFFAASSKTTDGVWIDTAPFLSLKENAEPSVKGEYVKNVLESSRDKIPHPTNWKDIFTPILNIAGVKSWSTFIKSAKYCSIEQDNEGFRFIPHKNMGKNGGYEVIQQNVFTLKTPFDEILDLAKIGDSLNKVFEFCE